VPSGTVADQTGYHQLYTQGGCRGRLPTDAGGDSTSRWGDQLLPEQPDRNAGFETGDGDRPLAHHSLPGEGDRSHHCAYRGLQQRGDQGQEPGGTQHAALYRGEDQHYRPGIERCGTEGGELQSQGAADRPEERPAARYGDGEQV